MDLGWMECVWSPGPSQFWSTFARFEPPARAKRSASVTRYVSRFRRYGTINGCKSVLLSTPSGRAMDSRRRSVMQSAIDPLANARSGIPMPSTIKKPSTNLRMSLAGPALRAPIPHPPSTNPRQSMVRSQNVNPLLQSTSKPNYGRTPLTKYVKTVNMFLT